MYNSPSVSTGKEPDTFLYSGIKYIAFVLNNLLAGADPGFLKGGSLYHSATKLS